MTTTVFTSCPVRGDLLTRLETATDALLAFVDEDRIVPYDRMTERFHPLDQEVVMLATAVDMGRLLPNADVMARSLDPYDLQPVQFVGGTRLPVDLQDGVYDTYPEQGWRQSLQTLAATARFTRQQFHPQHVPADQSIQPAPDDAPIPPPAKPAKPRLTLKEVAEKLERKRSQAEKFVSQRKLAEDLGCSVTSVNHAIATSPLLKAWAGVDDKVRTPRAGSLDGRLLDATAQSREGDPAKVAAEREDAERRVSEEIEVLTTRLIQEGSPELKKMLNNPKTKADFAKMPAADHLEALRVLADDPGQFPRILGRTA